MRECVSVCVRECAYAAAGIINIPIFYWAQQKNKTPSSNTPIPAIVCASKQTEDSRIAEKQTRVRSEKGAARAENAAIITSIVLFVLAVCFIIERDSVSSVVFVCMCARW